jgi:hypothetical protein
VRTWDGHELVDLPVRRLAHSSQLRSLVAHAQRVGNRSSWLTSRRCLPWPAWLTCRPALPGRAATIRWCVGPPNTRISCGRRLSTPRARAARRRSVYASLLRRPTASCDCSMAPLLT